MNFRNRTQWLIVALALFAGWQASQWRTQRNQPVHAQSDTNLRYQFQDMSGQSALTLYYPDTQTVYV